MLLQHNILKVMQNHQPAPCLTILVLQSKIMVTNASFLPILGYLDFLSTHLQLCVIGVLLMEKSTSTRYLHMMYLYPQWSVHVSTTFGHFNVDVYLSDIVIHFVFVVVIF